MSTTQIPNELECLATRLVEGSAEAVSGAQLVPHLLAAAAGWKPGHKTPEMAADLLLSACALQFDALRVAALVQAQDAALRLLYSLSLYGVDSLRLAASTSPGAQPGAGVQGLDAALETLADMQDVIQSLFPGDTCIST